MFKSIVVFILLALSTSAANAETYKWEDANGVHFTDNASSVPEKYREKQIPETNAEIKDTAPQVGAGIVQQSTPTAMPPTQPPMQPYPAAIYQANLEQQRRAAELMRQQQARALAVSTQNLESATNSLAKFMAVWLLIGSGIFATWVSTIVDIVKSDFVSPSNKTVWMLLVIFVPLLGMLLYFMIGHSQKHKKTDFGRNNNWEPYVRGNGRGFKGKGPDIF